MKNRLPSIREIAKIAGVSPSTVSRALNYGVSVSPAAHKKVEDAIAYLQTDSSRNAAADSHSVGIILSAVVGNDLRGHPSIFAIVSSFADRMADHNITCSTLIYKDAAADIQGLLRRPMDGYFVIGTSEAQDAVILKTLMQKQCPCLVINRNIESPHVSSVNFDDEYSSEMAVNHLIGLGHRRIAFVGGDRQFQNTQRRCSGYLSALKKSGIPVRDSYILFGDYSELSGYQMGKEILSMRQRPTAVYFASDTLAMGCMRYLSDHGLRLPRDMAIIGFGDIEASRYTNPPLTTIAQRDADGGKVAANALIQLMDTPSIAYQKILVKTELVIRESSGPSILR